MTSRPSIPELMQDLHEMEAERNRDRMLFWLGAAEGLLWALCMASLGVALCLVVTAL